MKINDKINSRNLSQRYTGKTIKCYLPVTPIPCSIIQSSKILEEHVCPPVGDGLNKPGCGPVRRAVCPQSRLGKVSVKRDAVVFGTCW